MTHEFESTNSIIYYIVSKLSDTEFQVVIVMKPKTSTKIRLGHPPIILKDTTEDKLLELWKGNNISKYIKSYC